MTFERSNERSNTTVSAASSANESVRSALAFVTPLTPHIAYTVMVFVFTRSISRSSSENSNASSADAALGTLAGVAGTPGAASCAALPAPVALVREAPAPVLGLD